MKMQSILACLPLALFGCGNQDPAPVTTEPAPPVAVVATATPVPQPPADPSQRTITPEIEDETYQVILSGAKELESAAARGDTSATLQLTAQVAQDLHSYVVTVVTNEPEQIRLRRMTQELEDLAQKLERDAVAGEADLTAHAETVQTRVAAIKP